MGNYYFLLSAFPPLNLGEKPEISFKELKEMLKMNLSEGDFSDFQKLLLPYDLYNIRALWLKKPFCEYGQIASSELEEELLVKQDLPEYLIDFLDRYDSLEERLHYFSFLYVSLYRDIISKEKGFLLFYFSFERELRLVLSALRAKEAKKDILVEFQFEDPQDPFVREILVQKDASDFIPPKEYEDVNKRFVENRGDPMGLNRSILEYRLGKIAEEEKPYHFDIDRVLSYVTRFIIVEIFSQLDWERGMEKLKRL